MTTALTAGTLIGAIILGPGLARTDARDAVSFVQALQWHHRVVLIVSDEGNLGKLEDQAAKLASARDTLAAHHIVVVSVHPEGVTAGSRHRFDAGAARQLREYYGLDASGFAVLLIGRDGGEKVRFTQVVEAGTLLQEFDDTPGHEADDGGVRVL